MKKVLPILFILSFVFCFCACGSKKTDDIEIIKNNTGSFGGNSVTALKITKAYEFSNGYAWIKYSTPNGEANSLINTSGKIAYTHYGKLSEVHDFTGKTAYTVEKVDRDNYIYRIIDKNGNEVISSEGGLFDRILAYGDGKYFVYKYVNDIDTSLDTFGVIDESGKVIVNLQDTNGIVFGFSKSSFSSVYFGNGIFALGLNHYYLLYDSNVGKFTQSVEEVDQVNYYEKIAIGDKLYFRPYGSPKTAFANDPKNIIDIGAKLNNNCFSISSDGSYEQSFNFDYIINDTLISNIVIRSDSETSQKLTLYDPIKSKSSSFEKYPVKEINAADDYFLLELLGVDNSTYYTLIDKNCNMLFEPIPGIFAKANEGKIVLHKNDGKINIMDYSGNLLFETSEYSNISNYNDGIAWAEKEINGNSSYYYGIDEKGNVIFS